MSNWGGADCEEGVPAVDVLGIEVDTLPQTKLERLKEAIYGVAGSEGVRKEGAQIASWPITACLSGDPVRAYISCAR